MGDGVVDVVDVVVDVDDDVIVAVDVKATEVVGTLVVSDVGCMIDVCDAVVSI